MSGAAAARLEEWAHAAERASRHSKRSYEEYCSAGLAQEREMAQVALDVPRTPVNYWNASADGGELDEEALQASLKNVLAAWVGYAMEHLDTELPYVQGMTLIAFIPLYVLEDEEAAFWLFVLVYTRCLSPHVFARRPALAGHRADTLLLQHLVRERFPDLIAKFGAADVDGAVALLATKWLLPVFSNALPKESVLSLWDALVRVPGTKAGNPKYALTSSPLFIWAASIVTAVKGTVVQQAKRMEAEIPVDVQLAALFIAAAKALPPGFKVEWTEVPRFDVGELLMHHGRMLHGLEMQRLSRRLSGMADDDAGAKEKKKKGKGALGWVAKRVTNTTKIVAKPAGMVYSMLPAMPRPWGAGEKPAAAEITAQTIADTCRISPTHDADEPPCFSDPPTPEPRDDEEEPSLGTPPPEDAGGSDDGADSDDGLTPAQLLLRSYPLDAFWDAGTPAPAQPEADEVWGGWGAEAAPAGQAPSLFLKSGIPTRSAGAGAGAAAVDVNGEGLREEKDLLDFLFGEGPKAPPPKAKPAAAPAGGLLGQAASFLWAPAAEEPKKGGAGDGLDALFGAPAAPPREKGPSPAAALDFLPTTLASMFGDEKGKGKTAKDEVLDMFGDAEQHVDPFTLTVSAAPAAQAPAAQKAPPSGDPFAALSLDE
eukprot:TRINITY_DN752_c0_g1_i1.p1 TRINITY_DN752_c0_g1~~TRINITY_DN752_c0_g1_i1.p1  ORF type:complete len:654 (+),score=224.69 TRINITY_DN752_c0_g1_i1:88-2049(+)